MDTHKLKTLLSTEPENHTCYLAYFDHLKTSLSDLSWTDWTEFNNTLNSIESPHPYIEELKKESLFLFSALISKDDLNRLTKRLFEGHTSSSDSLIAKYQSLIALGLDPFNTYKVLKEADFMCPLGHYHHRSNVLKETDIAADCLKDLRWHILVHYDITQDVDDVLDIAHFKHLYLTEFIQPPRKFWGAGELCLRFSWLRYWQLSSPLKHTEEQKAAAYTITLKTYKAIFSSKKHTAPTFETDPDKSIKHLKSVTLLRSHPDKQREQQKRPRNKDGSIQTEALFDVANTALNRLRELKGKMHIACQQYPNITPLTTLKYLATSATAEGEKVAYKLFQPTFDAVTVGLYLKTIGLIITKGNSHAAFEIFEKQSKNIYSDGHTLATWQYVFRCFYLIISYMIFAGIIGGIIGGIIWWNIGEIFGVTFPLTASTLLFVACLLCVAVYFRKSIDLFAEHPDSKSAMYETSKNELISKFVENINSQQTNITDELISQIKEMLPKGDHAQIDSIATNLKAKNEFIDKVLAITTESMRTDFTQFDHLPTEDTPETSVLKCVLATWSTDVFGSHLPPSAHEKILDDIWTQPTNLEVVDVAKRYVAEGKPKAHSQAFNMIHAWVTHKKNAQNEKTAQEFTEELNAHQEMNLMPLEQLFNGASDRHKHQILVQMRFFISVHSLINKNNIKSPRHLHFLKVVAHNIYKHTEKPVSSLARKTCRFANTLFSTLVIVFVNAIEASHIQSRSFFDLMIRPFCVAHAAYAHTPSIPRALLLYTASLLIEVSNVLNTAVSLISLALHPCFSSVHKPLRSYFNLPKINVPKLITCLSSMLQTKKISTSNPLLMIMDRPTQDLRPGPVRLK